MEPLKNSAVVGCHAKMLPSESGAPKSYTEAPRKKNARIPIQPIPTLYLVRQRDTHSLHFTLQFSQYHTHLLEGQKHHGHHTKDCTKNRFHLPFIICLHFLRPPFLLSFDIFESPAPIVPFSVEWSIPIAQFVPTKISLYD
mgnify:CR=1 FL=1